MRRLAVLLAVLALLSACGHGKARASIPTSKSPNVKVPDSELEGVASYYAEPYNGRRTASGEIFDTYNGMTAAHKTLPFNTVVRVKNLQNGEEVDVRINDRGPFVKGRVIDLSLAAAKEIDLVRAGVAPVKLKVLKDGSPTTKPSAPVTPPLVPPAPPSSPPSTTAPSAPLPIVPAPAEPETVPVPQSPPQETVAGVVDTASLPAYGVQVGAFQTETAAIRLRDDLALRYMNVSILVVAADQPLYRVRVGSVMDMASAEQLAKQLRDEHFNTFIVRLN
jgi:rare lipoprotein A